MVASSSTVKITLKAIVSVHFGQSLRGIRSSSEETCYKKPPPLAAILRIRNPSNGRMRPLPNPRAHLMMKSRQRPTLLMKTSRLHCLRSSVTRLKWAIPLTTKEMMRVAPRLSPRLKLRVTLRKLLLTKRWPRKILCHPLSCVTNF